MNPGAFELGLYTWNIEQSKLTQEEISIIQKYEFKNDKELENFCNKDFEVLWFLTPGTIIQHLKFDSIFKKSKKNTSAVVWETSKIPDFWLENYKKYFHQIIVPCDWNKKTFESQTGLPTFKIPYLVDISANNIEKNNSIFNIFSMSQCIPRKGFDILVRAYCSEFYNQDDVLLTIKTYGHGPATGKFEEDKKSITEQILAYKNSIRHYNKTMKCKINLITGLLSQEEINKIYKKSDIFCLPTRGEGFGLTIAESLANALPVIIPDKGGHIYFVNKENLFIESKFSTCFNNATIDYSSVDMKIIEPDLDDLRKQLRFAYDMWKKEPKKLQEIGFKSRLTLQNYCNPDKITDQLVKVLLN